MYTPSAVNTILHICYRPIFNPMTISRDFFHKLEFQGPKHFKTSNTHKEQLYRNIVGGC